MLFLSIRRNRQSEIIIISLSIKKNQPMRIENSLNNIFFRYQAIETIQKNDFQKTFAFCSSYSTGK